MAQPGAQLPRAAAKDSIYTGERGAKAAEHAQRKADSQISAGDRGTVELHSDPEIAQTQHALNFARKGGIAFGQVIYSQPYTHWYRVQLDDMDGDMPCCRITDTAQQPFAVRDSAPYPANTAVLCWIPEEGHYGYILGAIPSKVEDAGLIFPDWVSQGSGAGFKKDKYYLDLLQLCEQDGGVIDFSNNRPLDALGTDWGRFTDLGGGISLDNYLVFLRQSEHCGLFMFYMDMLTRLEGYNLDIRTAISELTARNDQGEGQHISGFSPYPWEALGAIQPGATLHTEVADVAVQYDTPRGKIEPQFDDQAPFHRYEEFRGYLGQGFMRHLKAPPVAPQSGGVNRYSTTSNFPGLFREQVGLNGALGIASAHSITLEKRSIIVIPRRVHPVEDDGAGDNENNYRAAGLFGAGPEHVVGDITAGSENATDQEASAGADFAAYAHQWAGLHPFHYHANDFNVPDDETAFAPFSAIQEPLQFSQLLGQAFLPDAPARTLQIDHRYGSAEYFERRSGVYLLPRGGVLIRGGGGEEIRMSGGNIRISCPGDIFMQPGKSVINYAGDDIVLRARKSVDITASHNDVRLKAEKNMEFLAGNSGTGRMLFENKAAGAFQPDPSQVGEDIQGSGIIFKAENSDFITGVREIYLRTGGQTLGADGGGAGASPSAIQSGRIYIDAARGSQAVVMIAQAFEKHLEISETTSFPVAGAKRTVHTFGEFGTDIGTGLTINGGLVLLDNNGSNGIQMEGWITIVNGHIATTEAAKFSDDTEADSKSRVFQLKDESLQKVQENLETERSQADEFEQAQRENYEQDIKGRFYDEPDQIGSEAYQSTQMNFSLRDDNQMNTQNFEFVENYWQQLAQAGGDVPGVWTENPVVFNGQHYWPHPGQAWIAPSWLTLAPSLYDGLFGRESPRGGGQYENYEYPEMVPTVAEGAYPVVSI